MTVRGGDHIDWGEHQENGDTVSQQLSRMFPLPDAPITDFALYFSDEELQLLAYSDTKKVTTKTLTLEMIELRKRREFLTSVLERHQRGYGVREGRLGHPRQCRVVR